MSEPCKVYIPIAESCTRLHAAQVVALGDLVGFELFSYNKVKAYRSVKRWTSPDRLPPILDFPVLVEWQLGCRSNRGRQDEF